MKTDAHHNTAGVTGKALVFKAMRHEALPQAGAYPRVPWVPFAGVHAGKLKDHTAYEVLTEGDKLLESLLAVNEIYDPDGQPVLFDLQVEAEILGCELLWAEDGPPTVVSHPLAAAMEVPERLPDRQDGRLPMILDVMREMKAAVGERTALYGLLCGPFTLAAHLRGTEVFMDMFDHVDFLHALFAFTRDVAQRMAALYIEAGMDVIAVVDPMISQISPRHFEQFFMGPFTDVFDFIRGRDVFSSFFVCGDATKNIEVMCQTRPDSISIDENIDIAQAKSITDRYNITIGGNIPLTTTMLLGTQQDNMKFVVDLLDRVDPHNLIISPGCDMPYETPIENVIAVGQAIRDPETAKRTLVNYHAEELSFEVDLPDYESLEKPLVEVFTLDSSTCAACSYMLGAAQRAADELAGKVDLVEYKFNRPENIARVKAMGVQKLPSIYVNGKLQYSSLIPSNRELLETIEKYIARSEQETS